MVNLTLLAPDIIAVILDDQWREGHIEKLIEMGELECRIPAGIARNTMPKGMQREMIHQLGEHQLAGVPIGNLDTKSRQLPTGGERSSSR